MRDFDHAHAQRASSFPIPRECDNQNTGLLDGSPGRGVLKAGSCEGGRSHLEDRLAEATSRLEELGLIKHTVKNGASRLYTLNRSDIAARNLARLSLSLDPLLHMLMKIVERESRY
ncbi:MAG: hypothetical protein OEZ24_01880 [Candidatus Bathyarchaeota archaeon]|nr:hypothetical protein [Candidatus Bathyarchaeota archaeon]